MAYSTFAAIDVGSYELAMKIYEISSKNGLREIDHIRHRIELGTDSYLTGKISNERIDELCRHLKEFKKIMTSYRVDAYKAYGTSAIREVENSLILLEQIRTRTGIIIEVLSNSEQRFLDYKSVASKGQVFQNIIEKGTVFIDIGGGSTQVSLFDKDSLITTQNIRPGVLRMREELGKMSYKSYQLDEIVDEIIGGRMQNFKELFIGDLEIENIIIVDDYVSRVLQKDFLKMSKKGHISADVFLEFVNNLKRKKSQEIATVLGIPEEKAGLLYLSALMIKHMIKVLGAKMLWAPGVVLCDGITYEYAEKNKLVTLPHNFEQDILACAKGINRRYCCNEHQTIEREQIALTLFDYLKKVHGLSKRDRLLLQLAVILNECGRYISLANVGESSYNIVMATEMIGLSHQERETVAYVVKYATEPFEYYNTLGLVTTLDKESYLKIAKLTAILRLVNGLDLSHKGKFETIKAALKDDSLIITIETNEDMTLEFGMIEASARFFEEVYNIKPVIKQKKTNI